MNEEITAYIQQVDEKWSIPYQQLLKTIQANIPEGFELVMQYNMPTFVVPLKVFPKGYLDREDEPLPFISLAAQKKHIALYHMGIMGNKPLLEWFEQNYEREVPTKLNMGKSCIRFTNAKNIPYQLIGELTTKISMEEWIKSYEKYQEKRKK